MLSALVATAFSTLLLVILCLGDPKRRRTVRLLGKGHGTKTRRIIVGLATLPGFVLALDGDAAAFLVWLGGSAAAGWFATLFLSQSVTQRAD